MPRQLTVANPVANEVFLHSQTIPGPGLTNTRNAQTFMCWISGDSTVWGAGTTYTSSICGMYDGTYNASTTPTTALQIGVKQLNPDGVYVWNWGGNVLVSTSPTSGNGAITPYTPTANTWFHVAYSCNTWTGTNQTHLMYINGVLRASSTNALQTGGQLTQNYINGFPQVPPVTYSETTNSKVDDVRLYSRQLSADEIMTIYNSRGVIDNIVSGLVAYYVFEEGISGQPANLVFDTSVSINNLIMQNNGGTPISYCDGVTGANVRVPQV